MDASVSEAKPALIELGAVGAPFGVRGWVRINSYTEPADALLDYPEVKLGIQGEWRVAVFAESGRSGGRLTARFVGVEDRTAAEGLRGARIAVARSELPPRRAGEHYRADLIGCEVMNLGGRRLGILRHFVDTPAHPVMVVVDEGAGAETWVPAVPRHLKRVDPAAKRVLVDWDEEAS